MSRPGLEPTSLVCFTSNTVSHACCVIRLIHEKHATTMKKIATRTPRAVLRSPQTVVSEGYGRLNNDLNTNLNVTSLLSVLSRVGIKNQDCNEFLPAVFQIM